MTSTTILLSLHKSTVLSSNLSYKLQDSVGTWSKLAYSGDIRKHIRHIREKTLEVSSVAMLSLFRDMMKQNL